MSYKYPYYKAFEFRIYPTTEQIELIEKTFGCCRFIFNSLLSEFNRHREIYNITEELYQNGMLPQNNYHSPFFNKIDMNNFVNNSYKKEFPFLKEVDKFSITNTIYNLGYSFDRFYKKLSNYPKFKSKRSPKQSYTTNITNNNIKVTDKYIQLPKLGQVAYSNSRHIDGEITSATIKRHHNKYYVSILCKRFSSPVIKPKNQAIGIDLGVKSFAVTSNGEVIDNPKFLRKREQRLKFLQRKLSKKQKNSNNYNKTKQIINKLHEKIYNQRMDFLHKLTTKLIRENQIICLENLKIINMLKNHKLAKSISEVSWGIFIRLLQYKAEIYGRKIIQIDTFYASSQLCHICGYKNPQVKNLIIREWECPICHNKHDRDKNASQNILKEGLRLI